MASSRQMRLVRWARLRVTVVSLVSLLILGTLIYLLSGGGLFTRRVVIFLYVPDATGVAPGAPVRVDGIDVGRVAAVGLSGSKQLDRVIRVSLKVDSVQLPSIHTDSTAQISADTLIGDKFVDIASGSGVAPIRPGQELRLKEQADLMRTLDLAQFNEQLRQIDAVLSDIESGKNAVGQLVLSADLYNDLRDRLTGLEKGLRRAVDVSGTLGQVIYGRDVYQRIAEPLEALDHSIELIQEGQGTAGHLVRDEAEYRNLASQVADLQKGIAEVRSGPLLASEALYADWNRKLGQWIAAVDDVNSNPAFETSAAYDNLNGMAGTLRDTLRDFRQNPRKYLRLKVF
ncbi:MAG: MlaD family protein [Bryobacteraceae bacterium]|jgi:phospholipid/cholesterol/gamma-HCH transport system substrate-binding protein